MDRPRSFARSVAHLSLAGYSAWDLPLSVAQHSLTVLAIRQASAGPGLTPPEALRELLDDAEEAVLGGWDPITRSSRISDRALTHWCSGWRRPSLSAIGCLPGRQRATSCTSTQTGSPPRARPPMWPPAAGSRCEKVSASRSSRSRMIHCRRPEGMRPWEPRPSNLAAHLFLARMNELQTPSNQGRADGRCRHVHSH
jgi:hypothetical protein